MAKAPRPAGIPILIATMSPVLKPLALPPPEGVTDVDGDGNGVSSYLFYFESLALTNIVAILHPHKSVDIDR